MATGMIQVESLRGFAGAMFAFLCFHVQVDLIPPVALRNAHPNHHVPLVSKRPVPCHPSWYIKEKWQSGNMWKRFKIGFMISNPEM